MSRQFYYDYFALKSVPVLEWEQAFFWPLERECTTQMSIDLKAEHVRLLEGLDLFEGDCLTIAFQITDTMVQVLNHFVVVSRLLSMGFDIVCSDKLTLVPRILQAIDGNSINFSAPDLWSYTQFGSAKTEAKYFLLSIRKNILNGNLRVWQHFSRNAVLCYAASNVIERPYSSDLGKWLRISFPVQWLSSHTRPKIAPRTNREFERVTDELCSYCRRYIAANFGFELPETIIEALRSFSNGLLNHIAEAYSCLKLSAARRKIRHALTATGGNIFNRAFSLAVRGEGGIVTGFPHGYYICHYKSPKQAFHELATVDEFAAYTSGSVGLIKRNIELNPIPRNNPVQIVTDNDPCLYRHWQNWENRPLPSGIKTVMVLELSLIPEWAGYHCAESMVNYHFYYNLCKSLSDKGFKVLFKRRPKDYDWEDINLFADIPNLELVHEPFESPGVLDQADAVFVTYAMSSCLYWSMCTNKVVVYVDSGWEPWFEDVYASMAKRCRILHCRYDERNRACFDDEELSSILKCPPEQPDTEFLERYLFPSKEEVVQPC